MTRTRLARAFGSWGSPLALAVLLFALGFLPLVGGPGYEAGLVAGLIAPLWAGWAGAFGRARPGVLSGAAVVARGLGVGSRHAASILLVAALHGLRSGFCEALDGFAFLALGACAGTLLGGVWGALVGPLVALLPTPRSRLGQWLLHLAVAWALPVHLLIVSIVEFYATPAVYSFHALVGFFAGPLYETVQFPIARLFSYRVGSALSVLALGAFGTVWSWEAGAKRISWDFRGRRGAVGAAALAAFGALALSLFGTRLGHRSTAASTIADLGSELDAGRCHVIYDARLTSTARAARLGRDCDAHLTSLGQYFGVMPPRRVAVFLFANDAEKSRAIGVGRTYVAKPWRREIYINEQGFPHPVLGHELAHVVAGEMGQGPFRVAGRFGGLLPDPGRIEGFAVAAAPREDTDASLAAWASAMLKLEQLPQLSGLFQLGFFGESAARSYMAAGAFVEFLRERSGPAVLRAWYGGGDLEALTGRALPELDAEFRARLRQVAPAEEVLAEAAQRFSGPAIFERRCPHLVDRLSERAEQTCGLDAARSARWAELALAHDPARVDLLLLAPRCELLTGNLLGAERTAEKLLQGPIEAPWQKRALLERAGDAAALAGDVARARKSFERALALTPSFNARRQLEVRLWALEQPTATRDAVFGLLTGSGPAGGAAAPFALGRWWGAAPEDAMAAYLVGKNLLGQGAPRPAMPLLRRAAESDLLLPSVRRESLRSWLIAAAELEDRPEAEAALRAILHSGPGPAREAEARAVAERISVVLTPSD